MKSALRQGKKSKTILRYRQWIKRFFILGILSSLVLTASAQGKVRVGVNLSKVFSGTGGSNIGNPSAIIQGKKYGVLFGVNTSRNNLKLTGGNFELRYYPAMEMSAMRLYFKYSGIMNYKTPLKYTNAVRFNTGLERDEVNLQNSTSEEHYGGFGLEYRLGRLGLETSIGVGYFKVTTTDHIKFKTPAVMAKVASNLYLINGRRVKAKVE